MRYAESRKVAGSSPDEVIEFSNLPNPSSRTMPLGSTLPVTEISTRNLPGGKVRPAPRTDRLISVNLLSIKCGSLDVSKTRIALQSATCICCRVRTRWRYASTRPYVFMAHCVTNYIRILAVPGHALLWPFPVTD
jgi:hypothetical protein